MPTGLRLDPLATSGPIVDDMTTTPVKTVGVDELGLDAELTVTVRTLHHYDEIGLLTPSERTRAGYRLYTTDDLQRLATIVTYRRLGMSLDEVAALLRGEGSVVEHLQRHRIAVMDKVAELAELADAIDRALERAMSGQPASKDDLKDIFGDSFGEEYDAEAQERWGDTDAWKQSSGRTARYTKADWEEIKVEMDAVNAALVAAKRSGLAPDSDEAMNAVEAPPHHRPLLRRFLRDAPRTGRHVRRRPAVHRHV